MQMDFPTMSLVPKGCHSIRLLFFLRSFSLFSKVRHKICLLTLHISKSDEKHQLLAWKWLSLHSAQYTAGSGRPWVDSIPCSKEKKSIKCSLWIGEGGVGIILIFLSVMVFFFLKMITLGPCTLIDFSFYDLDDFFSLFKWFPVFCKLPKA